MTPATVASWRFGQVAEPALSEPAGVTPASCAAEAELGIWSCGELVAIVRRRGGRTVEVVRVAGSD